MISIIVWRTKIWEETVKNWILIAFIVVLSINWLKIFRWLTVSADQVVILILLLALAVKYVFFEERDELAEQLMLPETPTGEETSKILKTLPLKIASKKIYWFPTDTAHLNVLLRRRFGPEGFEPMCQMDSVEKATVEDRGMQTDSCSKSATFCLGSTANSEESAPACIQDGQMTPPPTPAIKRELDECLSIYQSVVSCRS